MTSISYTNARNNLAKIMQLANDNREPVSITRNGHDSVVILSMEEYESIEATLHLLSSPGNHKRIQEGLKNYEDGKFLAHSLTEDR